MIKLPESVKIGAHTYKVIFPYRFKERSDYCAQIDYDMGEIRVSDVDAAGNKRIASQILVAFLHEVFHGIDKAYFASNMAKTDNIENLVEGLAQGMAQIVLDNELIPKAEVE